MSDTEYTSNLNRTMVGDCKCGRQVRRDVPKPGVGLGTSYDYIKCANCGHIVHCHQLGHSDKDGRVAVVFCSDGGVRKIQMEDNHDR